MILTFVEIFDKHGAEISVNSGVALKKALLVKYFGWEIIECVNTYLIAKISYLRYFDTFRFSKSLSFDKNTYKIEKCTKNKIR